MAYAITARRRAVSAVFAGLSVVFAAGAGQAAESVLFVGNSFTYGAYSPVWKYRADMVVDLNGGGVGGVPALFKVFARQAGLDYAVSLEAVGGANLDLHLREKAALIDRAWDHVVLQGYSTLDQDRPGDPAALVADVPRMATLFHARNPNVGVHLTATWTRADQTYLPTGHWYARPVEAMARDIRVAYDQAAAASPHVRSVIPVGEAWNRAFAAGFADANPYDGIAAGRVDLWSFDRYHASTFGYYLEALMVFGRLTARDPLSLGPRELAASELGLSPAQATALQQIAHDELAAHDSLKARAPETAAR